MSHWANQIQLIEIKSEIGAGTRGASLGVDAIKVASLNAHSSFFAKFSTVEVPNENHLLYKPTDTPHAKRIEGIVRVYDNLSKEVQEAIIDQHLPIVLAGDHASAGGSIAGLKMAFPEKKLGVIWIDAHADLHTPYTTPSGNVHGMPLAVSLGIDNPEAQRNEIDEETLYFWNELKDMGGINPKLAPEDIVFVAVRDVEPEEAYLMKKHQMRNFTVDEVRTKGAFQIVDDILEQLDHCDLIYLSFDVDSLDSDLISHGTGTPVPNGLNEQEATDIIKGLLACKKLACFEVVEVNPTLDEKKNVMAETAFRILEKGTNSLVHNLNSTNKELSY